MKTIYTYYPNLRPGYSDIAELNTKNEIKEIQTYLRQAGFNIGNAGVDGILGKNTKRAIYEFFMKEIGGSGTGGGGGTTTPPNNRPTTPTNPGAKVKLTLDVMRNVRFRNSNDINIFFQQTTGQDFVDFFRSKVGGRNPYWKKRKIPSGITYKKNFNNIFNQIPVLYGEQSINLFQFLGLVSAMINETGGKFKPIRESNWVSLLGRLKYAYGTNGGKKKSYNDSKSAKSVHQLIHDPDFVRAHKTPGVRLSYLRKFNWRGSTFPKVSLNDAEVEFLCQCDVYKFSGLGLIQTTWRPAYKRIINYVLNYRGTNPRINNVKMNWRIHGNADKVADLSKYQEWEYLFQEPEVASKAVFLHNQRSRYLSFSVSGLSYQRMLDKAGNIGYRIGGTKRARDKVRNRVDQIIQAMKRSGR
ncbi:peptidoglycan-binding domain-containing protein [Aquimarina spongiae]|uniref:Putative peptidoglycan binding domain-containing protein n=1 Tax=Aquimarina spongiae TaxID=570521 RepID=A0A1M6B9Q6_9FLAO|nr:peptidoglycan-binding domain-containing protein [Aquimarina spongiae]SHI45469.1 Putative peptidoglycan binding domain-containing protein [Aquimarina spongiae]